MRFSEYGDRVFILEELKDGAVLSSLSTRLSKHRGQAWHVPLASDLYPVRKGMSEWALSMVGTPYDFRGLLANIACRISPDSNRMICSEYAWIALREGIRLARVGLVKYTDALRCLDGAVPRPSDWPVLQKCGIYDKEVQLL
jgi:hypothetical protein